MTPDGVFVAVVGPSGAGKDSLIAFAREALRGDESFVFPTRMITRPADGTEQSRSSTPEAFRLALEGGAFSLHWEAHGLQYGLPAAIHLTLAEGRHVVANVSRSVIPAARSAFPRTNVILVTADRATLDDRLRRRGREGDADRERRLARGAVAPLPVEPDLVIDNNGTLEAAGWAFVRGIRQLTMPRLFALGL